MPKVKGLCSFIAAGSVGMVAGLANAQTICNRAMGPCIIVGDINGVANWQSTGTLDAFSLGTTSCNVGDAPGLWISGTSQHPVVGQNLFKMKTIGSGPTAYRTFEQIGQSWLKHTFFAFQQGLCCTGCQATAGNMLGVSCSDPYTPARNGSQSGLGPKWQVNAHTGAFAYPFASPPFQNDSRVARRLIVPVSRLEVSPNVEYIAECQYVASDCAAAGNSNGRQNQNYATSYRQATLSGGPTEFSLQVTATTVREKPAVYRWQVVDPDVTITTLDTPGLPEGTERSYVASRATDLGNGMWHYEFFVYNQNSDNCIGAVSVPLPASANVTNIGFSDVHYFDGDGLNNINFDGTDWTPNRVGDRLTWSTVSFAQNANGNAIRWGTGYAFRFDADVPPTNGTLRVSTWKIVEDYEVAAQVPSGGGGGCYANCDDSTIPPVLNVNDFICFQSKFAAGDAYANCDGSTIEPVLNVNDFICFQSQFAAGCSAP